MQSEMIKNYRQADVHGDDSLDLKAILSSDIPVALIATGPLCVITMICSDGSVCLTESGSPSEDYDDFHLPTENLLERISSTSHYKDLQADGLLDQTYVHFHMRAINGEPTLCGLSQGAKKALGFTVDATIQEIHEAIASQDFDGGDLFKALISHGQDLEDPLFVPLDKQSWTLQDIATLEPVLRDALMLHPQIASGNYVLRGATDGYSAYIYDEMEDDFSDPVIDVLREVMDFDGRFRGETYEYNDGAIGRESGYSPDAPEILQVEFDSPPSQHEKLAAWARMVTRLKSASVPGQTILDLIGNGEVFQ